MLAVDAAVARELVDEVRDLMQEHSILRGQVVTFAATLTARGWPGSPSSSARPWCRDDVVLPDGLLERVTDHVLGIAEHRAVLAEHGQHLKRGILLFGPPGTGKTHTVRYLLRARARARRWCCSAAARCSFIHDAAKVARAHQPAIVVLEDCDLIAEDRSFGPMAKPLLFEVLDALDGIDADADVAFLLTTNRVEHLERRAQPAARPRRPRRRDPAARRARSAGADPAVCGHALLRRRGRRRGTRAARGRRRRSPRSWSAGPCSPQPRRRADPADDHLSVALDALLSDSEALTRSLLGVRTRIRAGHGARTVFVVRTGRVLMTDRADEFLALHVPGTPLLLPNPWDAGSARLLAGMGFRALATTSAGFAGTHGRTDGNVTRDEALGHAATVVGAVDLPVSADLENGLADDPDGVAETVRMAVDVGLAGCSVEDWDPTAHELYAPQVAAERVAAAAQAAHGGERRLVLTARADGHIHGHRDPEDLDDTIRRLQAYDEAGADVLYAPGREQRRGHPSDRRGGVAAGQRAGSRRRTAGQPARRARGRARLHRVGPLLGRDGRAGQRGGGAA